MRYVRKAASPFKHLLIRRRLHAYAVGTARSGTKSLARVFQENYRAAHEPHALDLIQILLQASDGQLSRTEAASYVRRRDRQLWLEFESSQLVTNLLDIVVDLFPESRFVLSVRHPIPWLESIVNHELRAAKNPVWTRWAERVFQASLQHPLAERALRERGLFTVKGYLSQWARHNERVLDTVPEDRLLILQTSEISSSLDLVADFLNIPVQTLDSKASHANLGLDKIAIYAMLDKEYLLDQVAETCDPVMRRLKIEAIPDDDSKHLQRTRV